MQDNKIRMNDGTWKTLAMLNVGDIIYDGIQGSATVVNIEINDTIVYDVLLEDGRVVRSPQEQMWAVLHPKLGYANLTISEILSMNDPELEVFTMTYTAPHKEDSVLPINPAVLGSHMSSKMEMNIDDLQIDMDITEEMEELVLGTGDARDVVLPASYMLMSPKQKKAFLDNLLFDTDGGVTKQISVMSVVYRDQLMNMIHSIGGLCTLIVTDAKYFELYSLNVEFRNTIKVKDIQVGRVGLNYEITTTSPDSKLYVTDGYIPVRTKIINRPYVHTYLHVYQQSPSAKVTRS